MALTKEERDSIARKLYELVQEKTRQPEAEDLRGHLLEAYPDLSPVEMDDILEYTLDILEGRCTVPPYNVVDMETMGDRGSGGRGEN